MSGDLRAAVEGLHKQRHPGHPMLRLCEYRGCTFKWADALIPEGAVLVTEETLATAMNVGGWVFTEDDAAAILRYLREGT